ncbi:MAG: hypothetical protein ACJ8FY_12540 [Gemmataceae bacterium]
MVVLRRFIVLMALLFWQGGFLFYSSVVVPIGQEVLASHKDQGFITQRVTDYLNLSGAVALALLLWDLALARDPARWRLWVRGLTWLAMGIALIWLAWWHVQLDALLEPDYKEVINRRLFTIGHRWYLWISTVQWGCGLIFLWTTLWSWRCADRVGSAMASGNELAH